MPVFPPCGANSRGLGPATAFQLLLERLAEFWKANLPSLPLNLQRENGGDREKEGMKKSSCVTWLALVASLDQARGQCFGQREMASWRDDQSVKVKVLLSDLLESCFCTLPAVGHWATHTTSLFLRFDGLGMEDDSYPFLLPVSVMY